MTITDMANQLIRTFEAALKTEGNPFSENELFAGVDLGTATIVTAVVDRHGKPVAGALTPSRESIRDGLVLDYIGAIGILRRQMEMLYESNFHIHSAAAAYPPGISGRNAGTFRNVLEAVGLQVDRLIDEPTAASLVLGISDGAVVDIGGGTTGISVLRDGKVVYTADEPTGGHHIDLVIAGHYKIEVAEAERMKTDPAKQAEIFPLIRPVFQKMATIVSDHLKGHDAKTVYLVGGTSCFPGIEEVMQTETGLRVERPVNPLLVTPLGIALSCLQERHDASAGDA